MEWHFVETSIFNRRRSEYFDDDQFRLLQMFLLVAPEAGAAIPGGGGIRKLRWGRPGSGKRGGLRVVYLQVPEARMVLLLTVYSKSSAPDLSSREIADLAAIARTIREEVRQRGKRP